MLLSLACLGPESQANDMCRAVRPGSLENEKPKDWGKCLPPQNNQSPVIILCTPPLTTWLAVSLFTDSNLSYL